MALIGKIRNNSWILIVLIGVGMGGFILQDVMTNQSQRQAGTFELATINGKTIDYREFQRTEEVLYSGATNADAYAQKASLWRYFSEKAIVESEAEKLGIGVSTEELIDLQFGPKPSPIITARFKNQSGQLDRERLNSFRDAIEADDLDVRFKSYWAVQEKEIIKERQQAKLQNLLAKAVYTPNWLAEELSRESTSTAEFEYVKIPFDKIGDEEIELTDEAIQGYLEENKAKYQNTEETRTVSFVEFRVLPTFRDSMLNKEHLTEVGEEFAGAANDSLFTLNNSGNYSHIYYKPEDLPEQIREVVTDLGVGEVYGPYLDNGKYTIAKLLDKKMVADSVKARHILRSINVQDPASLTSAQNVIDSLKTVLEEGGSTFEDLAMEFSEDPGSAGEGGDLGYFVQGTMVVPFNNACFFGDPDEYQVVLSQFGVHLIEIQDRKFLDDEPKYKIAYISNAIVPSQETQDSVFDRATELVTFSESLNDLIEKVSADSLLDVKESSPLKKNDYFFSNYGSDPASRDIIRWAYEPGVETGDISPVVYTYTDKVNYYNSQYLVVGLNNVFPKGLRSVEEARSSVEMLVANQLKGEKIIGQIDSRDLVEVAAQFETVVDTITGIGYNATMIQGLGNEPRVISLVFNGSINEIAGPVIGNSGVYLVKPLIINLSDQAASNYLQQKTSSESKVKNEVNFRFMEALKKNAEIEDNRYNYY
jgi:peptidyl-prolyl cis-trans isomerase D